MRCWSTSHKWYIFQDYNRTYADSHLPVVHRACQHCGKQQTGLRRDPEEFPVVTISLDPEADTTVMSWVSKRRADKAMTSDNPYNPPIRMGDEP